MSRWPVAADYLDALIARSLNPAPSIRPRVPALFEPVRPTLSAGGAESEPDDEEPSNDLAQVPRTARRATGSSAPDVPEAYETPKSIASPSGTPPQLSPRDGKVRFDWSTTAEPLLLKPSPTPLKATTISLPIRLKTPPAAAPPPSLAPAARDKSEPGAGVDAAAPVLQPSNPAASKERPTQRRSTESEAELTSRLAAVERVFAQEDEGVSDHRPAPIEPQSATAGPSLPVRSLPLRRSEQRSLAVPTPLLANTPKPDAVTKLVQVTIGRVEIRALPEPDRRAAVRMEGVVPVGLADYMRRRNGAG
jgi:hypothetical protein